MKDEIYQNLIDWLNKACYGLEDSPHLLRDRLTSFIKDKKTGLTPD